MNKLLFLFLTVVLVFLSNEIVSTSSVIGDNCFVNATINETGVCKLIDDCPTVYNDPDKHKKRPKLCGFDGSIPIVCCPNNGLSSGLNDVNAFQTVSSDPVENRNDLSYCNDYSEFAYENIQIPGTLNKIKENRCTLQKNDDFQGKKNAEAKEFPHMVLIGGDASNEVKYFCTGALISDEYVLTSAHCIKNTGAKYVKIVSKINVEYFLISETIPYPRYSNNTFYNDIGLIKLNRPVELTPYSRPGCLSSEKIENQNLTDFITSTWEATNSSSIQFVKVRLNIVEQAICDDIYKNVGSLPQGIDQKTQICTKSNVAENGFCQINLGGPLQIFHPTTYCSYIIIGISSFAKTCGFSESPVVYTDVRPYTTWIESIVRAK